MICYQVQKPLEEQEKQPVIESNGPGTPEPEAVQAAPVLKISETKLKHETKLTVEEFAQTQDFKVRKYCLGLCFKLLLFEHLTKMNG